MRSLLAETGVHSFNEHIRGPETGSGAPALIVVARRFGCLHLIERHALLLHVQNPVPNDGHHVAVVGYIRGVTEPPVARNDICSSLFIARSDYQPKNLIQGVELTL